MIIISQNGDKVETNELRVSGHNIVALNTNDTNNNITVATYFSPSRAVQIYCEITSVDWSCKALEYVMPKE